MLVKMFVPEPISQLVNINTCTQVCVLWVTSHADLQSDSFSLHKSSFLFLPRCLLKTLKLHSCPLVVMAQWIR